MRGTFRFEDLIIWQQSILISEELLDIAEKANNQKFFRFSEQLRAAALSISNNIAEASGSYSHKDFANYLSIARKSLFECANMLIIFQRRNLLTVEEKDIIFSKLVILSKQITNFRKSLKKYNLSTPQAPGSLPLANFLTKSSIYSLIILSLFSK